MPPIDLPLAALEPAAGAARHRGRLCVSPRPLDLPVPSPDGPAAGEGRAG